jgi:uncharacterized 2Fe-2S/4Fe-4S cluster protein (DUF4445 family)
LPILTIWQNGIKQSIPFEGTPMLSQVLEGAGLFVPQPCGGRGHCGKCRVEASGHLSPPNAAEQKAGSRLACQIILLGDSEVFLPDKQELVQIQLKGWGQTNQLRPMPGQIGAAIDLGTTTLALKLFDLKTGALMASAAGANPQTVVAADVMGRIGAAIEGKLPQLQQMAEGAIAGLLEKACQEAKADISLVMSMVIAGNTTMLYLLTGKNPLTLSRAPFKADHLFGEWADILGKSAYLPRCMNAFVGADITCAVLASGMCEKPDTALLVDVGTNGEIALWKDGALHIASTAAGPAFEGAGIHMGCGSVQGAIDSVWIEEGQIAYHTIGEVKPFGVCGSGLIDAIAALLDLGMVEDTGATGARRLHLSDNVYLIPRDIRNVQLAKAAIAAGIRTLMHEAQTKPEDIHCLYLAGGFGSHLNIANAARIGLIPKELAGKVRVIGNAALSGAAKLLLNTDNLSALSRIAAGAEHVPLGGNPWFNEAYMEEMMFSD